MSSKLTNLSEVTSPGDSDVVYIVTDPTGAKTSQKVKVSNLRGSLVRAETHTLTAQSVAHDSLTTLLLGETSDYDPLGLVSTVSSKTRITVPSAGTYYIWGAVRFLPNSTGDRGLWFRKNNSDIGTSQFSGWADQYAQPTGYTHVRTFTVADLAANDYIEMSAYQYSGGALNIDKAEFGLVRM